jgi:hypothetical protein
MKKSAFASGTSSRRYNAKAHGAFLFRTLKRTVEKELQAAELFRETDFMSGSKTWMAGSSPAMTKRIASAEAYCV